MIQLENEFQVPLSVDDTWELLTDLPRIARCLPGARLDDVVDGEYRGGLSSRIGPITADYRGTASFLEHDEVAHRAVISARGREEAGSGAATATITAVLTPEGERTKVHVSTSLAISGRAAQFGRSLLADVSTSMVDEFVRRLETMIVHGETSGVHRPASAAEATPLADDNALDLGRTLLAPMLRRSAVPIAAALGGCVVGLVVGRIRDRATFRAPVVYLVTQALPAADSQRSAQPFRLLDTDMRRL